MCVGGHRPIAAHPPSLPVVAVIGQVQLGPDEQDAAVEQHDAAVVQHACDTGMQACTSAQATRGRSMGMHSRGQASATRLSGSHFCPHTPHPLPTHPPTSVNDRHAHVAQQVIGEVPGKQLLQVDGGMVWAVGVSNTGTTHASQSETIPMHPFIPSFGWQHDSHWCCKAERAAAGSTAARSALRQYTYRKALPGVGHSVELKKVVLTPIAGDLQLRPHLYRGCG